MNVAQAGEQQNERNLYTAQIHPDISIKIA